MIFLILLLIPMIIAVAAFVLCGAKITFKEFLLQTGIQIIVAGVSVATLYTANTYDRETRSGRVTSKSQERVSCSHAYPCNCRSYKCGKSTCTSCQTCHLHSYDVDWAVYTSMGTRLTIDRLDLQGISKPPRFDQVVIGEPAVDTFHYTNYIKASPGSLFRHQGLVDKFKEHIPAYPQQIYDYYRLDRLVTVGVGLSEAKDWNKDLSELNADLGPLKESNTIVVVSKNLPEEYFYALEQAWLGGKKNDVVVVINVDDEQKITWSDVMAWTTNELFKVRLRDQILDIGKLDRALVIKAINDNVKTYYVRKPMKDFEYLASTVTPTPLQFAISIFVGVLVSVGVAFWLHRQDVFGEERFSHHFNNRYRWR